MTSTIQIAQLVDHLFRHESGKMVSVLTGIFGTDNLNLAEDVVQDSLLEAMEQWQYKGVPNDPSAWLFTVAKNKALNILNREKYKRKYSSDTAYHLGSTSATDVTAAIDNLFSEQEIKDDQLRMIFTCCHPSISGDSQVALALKTLCGFSIPEIARAFLTSEENINKRLVRARQKIRDGNIPFQVPEGNDLENRLNVVLETIYLLFNEGYSASTGNEVIRYEVCEEAIRLAQMIGASRFIHRKGKVFALLSLMFLNASRFNARQDNEGNLLTMAEQDRSLWDERMKEIGLHYLSEATQDESISIYHILAAISANYSVAPNYDSTDWKSILFLYDSLVEMDSSPVVLLNRAIAIAKVHGWSHALNELEKIQDDPSLRSYYLFYSTQAEFYMQLHEFSKAVHSLDKAIQLAPLDSQKELLRRRREVGVGSEESGVRSRESGVDSR